MKERLLITTAIGLMLGTAAFAQSPSEQPKNNPPPAAQNQTNSNSSARAASSSTASSPSLTPSAQNTQSTPSGAPKSATTTSQSAPNTTGNSDPSRSQAQSNQASQPSQGRTDNNAGTAPSQAQSAQPSNSPTQAQTNTAPPANSNQTQSSPTGTNANTDAGAQPSTNTAAQPSNNQTNTAAQPSNNQTNTAQSPSSNIRVSANLNESQRTRVTESIARLNVAPLNNVNFSLSVGTVVPRDVRFQPLPPDIVEVMPQYRGYSFLVVRDEIVIVEPATYKIVDVLPRTGRSTAAVPAPHRTTFSDRDREVIRKHARSSRIEQRTTGSSTSTRVKVGERLPDSVEIRSFPDEVYRESPSLREYRYIERDNRTYVVEPRERTIIEEIE